MHQIQITVPNMLAGVVFALHVASTVMTAK